MLKTPSTDRHRKSRSLTPSNQKMVNILPRRSASGPHADLQISFSISRTCPVDHADHQARYDKGD
jgi:hypothetical protein